MTDTRAAYEDIPGTYLFDRERCRAGLPLNMFCRSLLREANRREFLAGEERYLDRYRLTGEQRRCVLERDWTGMLRAGGNIYYLAKLGAALGFSFQYLAGVMSGMTQEEYRNMMAAGGRGIEGNRSRSEGR